MPINLIVMYYLLASDLKSGLRPQTRDLLGRRPQTSLFVFPQDALTFSPLGQSHIYVSVFWMTSFWKHPDFTSNVHAERENIQRHHFASLYCLMDYSDTPSRHCNSLPKRYVISFFMFTSTGIMHVCGEDSLNDGKLANDQRTKSCAFFFITLCAD